MSRTFVITGNGAFLNRGCEAIFRGTVQVLAHAFGPDIRVIAISHGQPAWIAAQAQREADPRVTHLCRPVVTGRNRAWLEQKMNRTFGWALTAEFAPVRAAIAGADAVLSAGGDNYSLDYGLPYSFLELDRYVMRLQRPLIIWGASVGPFSANSAFERQMARHLSRVTAILVREEKSSDYLHALGIGSNRVFRVADPAFHLAPERPKAYQLPSVAPVGINLSTMQAQFATQGNLDAWVARCRDIVMLLLRRYDGNVVLVPHVTGSAQCDHVFLSRVADQVAQTSGVRPAVVPETLTAGEYKWVISQCRFFIGARTHSTIAALSSGVPTISLAYSIKAWGLNDDILGTTAYCIDATEVTASTVQTRLEQIEAREAEIRAHLHARIPILRDQADEAGRLVARLLVAHTQSNVYA